MKSKIIYVVLATSLIISGCDSEKSSQPPESIQSPEPIQPQTEQINYPKIQPATESLAHLYQQSTRALFRARALSATLYGLSEEEVGQYYANKMEDYSPG